MNNHRWLELGGFGLLFGVLAYSWLGLAPPVPWADYAINPAYFALVAATVTAPLYAGLRLMPRRRPGRERLLLAAFLAGMPVIYLWAALRAHDGGGVVLESVGLVVYGACAWVGLRRRSTLLLGLGIAAHGVGWDAWHHGHTVTIEAWYPLGCLIVDMAFGLLVVIQSVGSRGSGAAAEGLTR